MVDHAALHALLSRAQEAIGAQRFADALGFLSQALELSPENVPAVRTRAEVSLRVGNLDAALLDLYHLLRLEPSNADVRNQIRFIHKKIVPSWHFDMMNDTLRNQAYEAAITAAVKPGMTVFEIGTGSGLLSMMAARAGARHVYTCEKSLPVRNAARQIIARNGFSERITVIDKWSTSVEIPGDLPQRVDVVIGEIFGPGLLEEQAFHFFDDAKSRLLKPGGTIVPGQASIFGALFQSEEVYRKAFVGTQSGFDLSLFNGLHDEASLQLNLSRHEHRFLSEDSLITEANFSVTPRPALATRAQFVATHSGICHGVVQWFSIFSGTPWVIDSSPRRARTHWDQYVQVFERPLEVTAGQRVEFRLEHFSDRIAYRLVRQ